MSAGPSPRPGVTGAVLAGGASRRMGRPKALVEVDGTPLARLVADSLLAGGARRVLLVGGEPAWGPTLGLDVVPDRWPGLGPLGGLATALSAVDGGGAEPGAAPPSGPVVVVAACDQPALTGQLVARLVAALDAVGPAPAGAAGAAGAAAFRAPGRERQPFPSAWRPTAAGSLARLVEAGERRAGAAFGAVPVVDLEITTDDLVDLDTPSDLRAWLESGRGRGRDRRPRVR